MNRNDVDTMTNAAPPSGLLETIAASLLKQGKGALFDKQMAQLASLLNARLVYITELVGTDTLHTLASWQKDEPSPGQKISPVSAQCVELIRNEVKVVERALGKQFPDDKFIREHGLESYLGCPLVGAASQAIGHLSVYSDQCITEPDTAIALTRLFAASISTELQNQRCRQQIKNDKQFLQTLLDNLPGMAYRGHNDQRWSLWFVSDGCEPLTGYPRKTFENGELGLADITHPDDKDNVWREMHRRLAAGERFELEYRILTRFGEEKWIREQGCGVRNDNGEITSVEGVIIDITPRKTSQLALERSEAYFKAIINTAAESIITIDAQGVVGTFNNAAEQLFGYAADEVIGQNIRMLMPEPHHGAHDQYINRFLKTGDAKIIGNGREVPALRKDGSVVPIHLSVSEIVLNGSRCFAGIIHDLSEEKAVKEALRREHELHNAIIEQAHTGIATCRFDGSIVTANRAACDMTGYTLKELKSMTMLELTHPNDLARTVALAAKAAAGKLDKYTYRKRFVRKDGTVLEAQVTGAVVHDANGEPELLIGQMEDLTPRLRAEAEARDHRERLARADRLNMLGEMTAGIAHEINQPLTAISLFAQAGKRLFEAGDYEKMQDSFDRISQHAQRAGAVMERMQHMARQRKSSNELVDCNDLIEHVCKLAEADARLRGIIIEVIMADEPLVVDVDAVQIEQVALNLLRNGMEAMREEDCRNGKTIWIKTWRRADGDIEVAVIDSGTGISDKTAIQLFTPFVTTKDSGIGLGLSISRTIVNAHGGKLDFHNNVSGGATFSFTLPAVMREVAGEDQDG